MRQELIDTPERREEVRRQQGRRDGYHDTLDEERYKDDPIYADGARIGILDRMGEQQ